MLTADQQIRQWWIYKIVNPAGRIYIGKTSNLKRRLNQYALESGGGCNQQPIIYNSLLKYGFDSHVVEVLETFASDNSWASGKEIFWIRSYMTNVSRWRDGNGMNLSDGGDGNLGAKFLGRVSPFKGKKHTEENKKFLSEYFTKNPSMSMLGKKISDESKKKMSAAKAGKGSPHKGKKYDSSYSINQSISKLGKPNYKKRGVKINRTVVINTSRQPVLLFNEDNSFCRELYSKREAERVLGTGKGMVNNLLNGFLDGKYNGYIIKYK